MKGSTAYIPTSFFRVLCVCVCVVLCTHTCVHACVCVSMSVCVCAQLPLVHSTVTDNTDNRLYYYHTLLIVSVHHVWNYQCFQSTMTQHCCLFHFNFSHTADCSSLPPYRLLTVPTYHHRHCWLFLSTTRFLIVPVYHHIDCWQSPSTITVVVVVIGF